ncbi:tandem-95 repeat protein [Hahella ganghwensis]|uniref:tandem-95 repeat protein n=1 Tax=Hahella ganghwensis TaxID=286420 RepID=UPI00037502A5|nr:tandem-95 repeat protein [Hahella ganghwensis]
MQSSSYGQFGNQGWSDHRAWSGFGNEHSSTRHGGHWKGKVSYGASHKWSKQWFGFDWHGAYWFGQKPKKTGHYAIAESLIPPGDSDRYRNPYDAADNQLNVSDWVQGVPGVKNSSAVRSNLDALLQRNIIIPVWDRREGHGANTQFRVARFAVVELQDYRLNGKGYISFVFKRFTNCYNFRPVSLDQSVTVDENSSVTFSLFAEDVDGNELQYEIVEAPQHGTIEVSGTEVTYTPTAGYSGADSLTYQANDGEQLSNIAIVSLTVLPVNDRPVAENISSEGAEDTAISLSFAGSDAENDPLTFRPVSEPEHGAVIDNGNGYEYQPNPNYFGQDQFTYVANDGDLDSEPATYTISVLPVNDVPVILSQPSTMLSEGETFQYQILAQDVDQQPLSFGLISGPEGTVINTTSGLVSWETGYTDAGSYGFVVAASDGETETRQSFELTVKNVNRVPVIQSTAPDQAQVGERYQYQVFATDPDGDELKYALATSTAGMTISESGLIRWTPVEEQIGELSFSIVVIDTEGLQAFENVSLVVEGVANTAPVITFVPKTRVYAEHSYLQQMSASDADGDSLAYSSVLVPDGMSVNSDSGEISWTPAVSQVGSHVVSIAVSDNKGGRDQLTFTLTVIDTQSLEIMTSNELPDAEAGKMYSAQVTDVVTTSGVSYALVRHPDGMTIDQKTGELTWQPGTEYAGASLTPTGQCEVAPEPIENTFGEGFQLVEKWHWEDGNNYSDVVSTPLLVNLYDENEDGRIDTDDASYILAMGFHERNRSPAKLRAYNAETGELKWTANADLNHGYVSPAVADLDGDGDVEIVTTGPKIFDHNGQLLRESTVEDAAGRVSIADLDADGVPEILHSGAVFDASLNVLFTLAEGGAPIAVDLDLDGKQEVFSQGMAWDYQGNLLWQIATEPMVSAPSVGNFDSDEFPEIVISTTDSLMVLNHDGSILWQAPKDGNANGAPLIADLDGDGLPEIGLVTRSKYVVYETDGQFKWSIDIDDDSSGNSASTAFDFNGDGALEIVHGDESYVRILDGRTGQALWTEWNTSSTGYEYPIVADIDNDGHAELVITAYKTNAVDGAVRGIRAFEPVLDDWPAATRIINQHAYSVTNINTDGSVPVSPMPSWLAHNSYRASVLLDRQPLSQADLVVDSILLGAGTNEVIVEVQNIGQAKSVAGVTLSLYSEHPGEGSTALAGVILGVIPGHSGQMASLQLPEELSGYDVIYAKLTTSAENDCNQSNDLTKAMVVVVEVQDNSVAVQQQSLLVNVNPNEAPQIKSIAGAYATEGSEYLYRIQQQDLNETDSFIYDLISGPAGANIDQSTGVLSWIPESAETSAARASVKECNAQMYSGPHFELEGKWFWSAPSNYPDHYKANATPILAQLNDDNGDGEIDQLDIPDILVATYEESRGHSYPGVLRALSGVDGSEIWQNELPVATPKYAPAVADIDRDGLVEIIVNTSRVGGSQKTAHIYEHDGSVKYELRGLTWSPAYVTDMTGDGYLEFLYGGQLYNRKGSVQSSFGGVFGIAVDLDLDGRKELISNGYVHDASGNRQFSVGGEGEWGVPAFANLDNDSEQEVLNIWPPSYNYGKENIAIKNHDGSWINGDAASLFEYSTWGVGSHRSPYALADVDGDTIPEIVMASGNYVRVYEKDSTLRWTQPVASNQRQGVTAFDFDGDGRSEVVFADNEYLRIYDGVSGVVLAEIAHPYQGSYGNPVVADVDGDGQAEIIAVMQDNSNPANNGVKVYEAKYQNWSHTRSQWNQFFYSAGSIDDQGNVLPQQDLTYNSFLENPVTTFQVDLIPEDIRFGQDSATLSSRVFNRGMRTSGKGSSIRVYEGDPAAGGTLLGEQTLNAIAAGEYQNVNINLSGFADDNAAIYVIVDEEGLYEECDDANNTQIFHRFKVRVTDDRGLSDEQSFIVSAYPQSISPVFDPVGLLKAETLKAFRHMLVANDANEHDILTYDLVTAPLGLVINKRTGELKWTPPAEDQGDHSVTVSVTDKTGNLVSQQFTIEVAPTNNRAPVVTSSPVTEVEINQTYSYQLAVSDLDGDELTYELHDFESGMSISPNGLIEWTPTQDQVGDSRVTVQISDGYWTVEHSFIVTVNVPANNAFPEFTSTPTNETVVAADYQYLASASDADGDTLSFSLFAQPSGMTIDSVSGLVSWTPAADQAGIHEFYVRVSDGVLYTIQPVTLRVWESIQSLKLFATMTLETIDADESLEIYLSATGGMGVRHFTLAVDGASVDLDSSNSATLSGYDIGVHQVSLSVSDDSGSVSDVASFIVRDPNDKDLPLADIASPEYGTNILAPVEIIGTATDANLLGYRILISEKGREQWRELASGSESVNQGVLGTIDPTQLINGLYDVVLEVTDLNGQVTYDSTLIKVDSDLKVGNFTITLEDLNIPMMGLPIQVTRTYDSRRKHEALDFGYGWSVGYQNVKVEESRVPGEAWALNEYASGPLGVLSTYCVEPLGKPVVTVTLPGGDVETFEVAASPSCVQNTPVLDVKLAFNGVGDTQSTLEVSGGSASVRLVNNRLEVVGSAEAYDPDLYELTTQAGYIYYLDQNFGVKKVEDPNGHTLTYTNNGIYHSSGKAVTFNRDSLGRITTITDLNGHTLNYTYNIDGDLSVTADALDEETSYTYNQSHGLLDIIDPLGRTIVRNIYDDDGRLIAQEDSDGNRTDFNHDIEGRQSVVTDRNGNTSFFYYNDRGDVTSKVDAEGYTWSYSYDENGNQLSEINPLGYVSSATFDERNNQLTQTDELGNTVSFSYNLRGQELTISDARGNVYTNTYDSVGNLLTVTDPTGNIAGNHINAKGLVSKTIDVAGNETSYTYDDDGNKLTETNALGQVTSFTYDDNGNVLTETRTRTVNGVEQSETTSYVYDARNRVVETRYVDGSVTSAEYDAVGNQVAVEDALGRRTEMDYDTYGRVLETRYPDGSFDSKTYDAEGNVLTETDRKGRMTQYTYDALNRVIRTDFADGSYSSTEYDAAGRVFAQTDANGNRTVYSYDAAGRRTAVQDALGNVHTFNYDADGNLVSETDANGHTTRYEYNVLDQRVKTVYHDGSFTTQAYDALGRRIGSTDQAGKTTRYEYDALGRLIKVIDVLGQDTSFTYDEVGNKLTQTDAEGRTTRWTYDSMGRVLSRTLPMGQVETSTYDVNGNLKTHTDFNGQVTTYTYDINNRVIRVDYADGEVETFKYDVLGNRTEASNSLGTTTYRYDTLSRLVEEVQPNGAVLTYDYDKAGNKTETSVTIDGRTDTTTYLYDSLNRLSKVIDADGGETLYSYDAVGNRETVTQANSQVTTYTYDSLNRLTRLTTEDRVGNLITDYRYTLHSTGRRTQIEELHSGRTSSYTYDDLYRLTKDQINDPVNGDYVAEYQYDKVGNRTYSIIDGVHTAYSYDDNDRLTRQGGVTYVYDANGNTLTETEDGVVKRYTYSAKNKLIEVEQGGDSTVYGYNVDGIRISKAEGSRLTDFIVDQNRDYAQVLQERVNGTETARYTYGDDLLSQARNGNASYYVYDGLGSVRSLTDRTGTETDSYQYDAFGILLASTGSTENDYRYTGEQYDAGLDQYYLRARYYDQGVGRFTQMDTYQGRKGEPLTLHKYLYAHADSINGTDPSGYMTLMDVSASNNVLGTMIGRSIAIINTIDKLQGAIGVAQSVAQAFSLLSDPFGMSQLSNYLDTSNKQFEGVLGPEAVEHTATVLKRNAGKLARSVVAHKYKTLGRYLKDKKSSVVFYLPTPGVKPGPSQMLPTPLKLRLPGFGNKPVKLAVGGHATRYFGVGFTSGSSAKASLANQRQLFRVDWKIVGKHSPGDSKNADYWVDEGLEFHVPREP